MLDAGAGRAAVTVNARAHITADRRCASRFHCLGADRLARSSDQVFRTCDVFERSGRLRRTDVADPRA